MKLRQIILLALLLVPFQLFAAGSSQKLLKREWPFDGFMGTFDRQSVQRGFQVYQEVCSACHSLKRIYYRNLMEIGFSEDEAKTVAASAMILDGPNDDGEMFERPGIIADAFVSPYPNDNAARASNGGAMPPDLSLIIKARPDGANYLYSLLNGYMETPKDLKLGANMHFNIFFPGYQISMPKPLNNGQVEYQDGTNSSVEQMSYDLVNFLQWAAEPEMEQRKRMGIKIIFFLAIASLFFYLAKRKIWSDVH
jgi:ubiquinol-cytochrome c reductase cytochrome c1 subunit